MWLNIALYGLSPGRMWHVLLWTGLGQGLSRDHFSKELNRFGFGLIGTSQLVAQS